MDYSAPIPDGTPYDFSKTGIPLLDMIIDLAIIGAIIFAMVAGAWVTKIKPWLDSIHKDAKAARENSAIAREQTENSHANSPNPNLRDNIDANHVEILAEIRMLANNQEQLGKGLTSVINTQVRQDKELARINDTLVADREEQRRLNERFDNHVQLKANMEPRLTKIETHLEAHREITEDPT